MIGKSPQMARLTALIAKASGGMSNVLIEGETGTGKELIAQAIHAGSVRRGRPFVPVNCSALPQSLAESELFGHERGAFTGAVCRQAGLFELAHGGTLFLDELGEMSLPVQAKLLRVIETRTVRRLGGGQMIPVDIRIIAATHRNLRQAAADGEFREDLYYRLNVFPIKVPPLRERREDILELAEQFLIEYAKQNQRIVFGFSAEAESILMNYDWPGNVRQLRNVIEQAVVVGSDHLVLRCFTQGSS